MDAAGCKPRGVTAAADDDDEITSRIHFKKEINRSCPRPQAYAVELFFINKKTVVYILSMHLFPLQTLIENPTEIW